MNAKNSQLLFYLIIKLIKETFFLILQKESHHQCLRHRFLRMDQVFTFKELLLVIIITKYFSIPLETHIISYYFYIYLLFHQQLLVLFLYPFHKSQPYPDTLISIK
jgi:hypothetical protein